MKISTEEMVLRLVEVFAPIFAGYFVYRAGPHDREFILEIIIVPLLVIVACEFVHAKYIGPKEQEHKLAQQLLPLRLQMQKITDCLASSDIAPRLMIKVLGRANADVNAGEIDEVWNQLTWSLTKNYFATNYIDYDAMFGSERAKAILATQRAKKLAGDVEISKVFIVETDAEMHSEAAKNTLLRHRNEEISDLRYIVKDQIAAQLESKFTIDMKHIDFSLFDNEVVLVWHYNENRRIESGKLLFGEDQVKPYREFAKNLKSVAKKCPA